MVDTTISRDRLLREALFSSGFDIFHGPFSPALYNDLLESEGLVEKGLLSKLPEKIAIAAQSTETNPGEERTCPQSNVETIQDVDAYLIGNTKHLWPVFLRWLYSENEVKKKENLLRRKAQDNGKKTEDLMEEYPPLLIEDPLDTYEQSAIKRVVGRFCTLETIRLYWSSDYDPSRMVSMARIASCTGFSYLDPHTHLSVHPAFGTWHSYRAVLLLPKESRLPSLPPPVEVLSNPVSPLDQKVAVKAFDNALTISMGKGSEPEEESSGSICEEDATKLSEELGRGNYNNNDQQKKNNDHKTRVACAWIHLREAISIGRENYRFDDNQLWYHYTKETKFLFQGMQDLGIVDAIQ